MSDASCPVSNPADEAMCGESSISRCPVLTAIVVATTIVAFGLLVESGLRWGVPSRTRNQLEPPPSEAPPKELIEQSNIHWGSRGRGTDARERFPRNHFNSVRSYHPDEYLVIKGLSNMRPSKLDFDPRLYIYPAFHYYLVGAAVQTCSMVGLVEVQGSLPFYFENPGHLGRMYVIGRWVGLVFAGLCILMTFLIARLLFGGAAGWLALPFVAATPAFVVHSHYMTRDLPGTFFILCLLFCAAKICANGRRRWYALAGVSAGAALGCKYITLFLLPLILLAHFLAPGPSLGGSATPRFCFKGRLTKAHVRLLLVASVVAFLIFFCVSPYSVIRARQCLTDFFSETDHMAGKASAGGVLSLRWVVHLFAFLPPMLGWPLAALACLGLILAIAKRTRSDILLLGLLLPVYLIVGIDCRVYSRYYVPIVPVLVIFAARALTCAGDWLRQALPRGRMRATAGAVLCLAIFVPTLMVSAAWAAAFTGEDTRTQAGRWIARTLRTGTPIAMTHVPWQFEMPPIDSQRFPQAVVGHSLESLSLAAPYFVTTSCQYGKWFLRPDESSVHYRFWRELVSERTGYRLLRQFREFPSVLWLEIDNTRFPEDMQYVNPIVRIYRRKDARDGSPHFRRY